MFQSREVNMFMHKNINNICFSLNDLFAAFILMIELEQEVYKVKRKQSIVYRHYANKLLVKSTL